MEDDSIDSLLKQLQESPKEIKRISDEFKLNSDELENFVLEYCGRLIKNSVESVENMKPYAEAADGDSEGMEAYASLIKASASTIDVLQKILTAREKNATNKEVTQMKIESIDKNTDKELGTRILLSREDLIKQLIDKAHEEEEIYEIEYEEID